MAPVSSFLCALHAMTAIGNVCTLSSLCVFILVNIPLVCRKYNTLPPPRNKEEKAMLDSMLRVDHAGEYGANRIYAGQMAVLGRTQTGPVIQVFSSLRERGLLSLPKEKTQLWRTRKDVKRIKLTS